jgi:hypothetical protein
MAQKTRQNKIFAAEDYTVVYESYVNANFQAFDYDTIRTAMVDYVRSTYPENYNDWIESAEFISLLDVVAQFGHNLAYRVDLNARNNFLTTAEKQESVFKLAEFLGYSPRRNVPAYGEMKVVAVKTNEAVIGSTGASLGGTEIRYEVTNDVNNLDDFITIVNSTLQNSNQYGSPNKSVVLNNIRTDFYDLNNTPNQIKFDVEGTVTGATKTFNIISSDYNEANLTFKEKSPDPVSNFGMYFKNDGRGIGSANTGFFFGVKQGNLSYQDFDIADPIDSNSVDINVPNINNTDCFVQNISTTGNLIKEWTKVKDVNSNVVYNSLASGVRDIFSIKTRENNQISILFPDRTFGNIPKDTIRVWYRPSENTSYILRPDDLTNKKINITYTGRDGNTYNAVFTLQLKQAITNATSSESLDSIRENAPKNYASQDRMITAQDYNTILANNTGGVIKVKSINRTFSGHSRYSKFIDPTGEYSNLYLQGADARLYQDERLSTSSTSGSYNTSQMFNKYVKDVFNNDEYVNLYYTKYRNAFNGLRTEHTYTADSFVWQSPSQTASGVKTGYLTNTSNAIVRVGNTVDTYMQFITPGALLKFTTSSGSKWAKVVDVFNFGLGIEGIGTSAGEPTGVQNDGTGSIILDAEIPSNSTLDIIYPALSRNFSTSERDHIITYLDAKKSFSVKYNFRNKGWEIDTSPDAFNANTQFPDNFNNNFNDWSLYFNYINQQYDIHLRTVRFNFTSNTVRLGNIQNEMEISSFTKKAKRDSIQALGVLNNEISRLGKFYVYGYDQVSLNTYRIVLVDGNADSRPANPDVFYETVGATQISVDSVFYTGRENLNFEWEHIASDNQVVDPSFTNVIDVFALTTSYDTEYKNWLLGTVPNMPLPPTSYELGQLFTSIGEKKAMSDTIVYKPVKYKCLFGANAEDALRARFRVIKLTGSNITETDLKNKTVEAIKEFFDSSNWDFGETFYFTELAAYVHKKLAGVLSSFVIVPQGAGSVFGDMFQFTPDSNELIIPDVSVNDIDIIQNITDENIRAGT